MAGFKPSPPPGARPGAPRLAGGGGSPLEDDSLRATLGDLIGHGQGQPKQVAESLSQLRFGGGKRAQRAAGGEGKGADWNKWELRSPTTWNHVGPDPNKERDPQGRGVFGPDPQGGAGRETGLALPGGRDTWRPARAPAAGRRAAKRQDAEEKEPWSPNRHFPEGLHQLSGAERAPHPFNLTTDYGGADFEEPTAADRKKAESRLNALRQLRHSRLWSTLDWQQRGEVLTARDETERGILIFRTCLMLAKMEQNVRLHGRTVKDVASMFQAMDADGSGGLDYEEFKNGLKAMDLVFGPKQLDALIEALDQDGDGEISIKEFLAQCDDEYREDGALGEMDEESKARQASLSPKKEKAARKNVFGQTMNLTIAADQALYNRHTRAKGAQPFKLAAKREIVPVAEDAKAGIEKIMEFIKIEQLKLTDMFYKIDVDGSGDIEPMELVEALRKMGLTLSPAELNAVVHELDVDGDGSVELHEYLTQMKRINRARFSQKSHAQPTRATGWVVGSHGVPWLQPPTYGSQIGNWGRIGRTRATTNKGNLASFEMRQKTFATQQQKFRQAASATGQLRASRKQGGTRGAMGGSQTARAGPPLMLPPSALPPSGSQSAR